MAHLNLTFVTGYGGTKTLRIPNARTNLNDADVRTAMIVFQNSDAFETSTGALVARRRAVLVQSQSKQFTVT